MSDRNLRILFYSTWVLINILQASFTTLLHDEAYYWYSAFFMDWGHFYYPPFIDILSRAGYFLIGNELGLRLFYIASSTAGVYLLEKLIRPSNQRLFYAVIISILFLQVGGMFAAPDIPLFLFGVVFFLLTKQYLESPDPLGAFKLAIITALMLYTKYHGITIIAFTFLYNLPRFWRVSHYYIWPAASIILFLPHLYWQIVNEFPTFTFHLFNRPGTEFFKLANLDYIPGQLLFTGPIVGFFLFLGAFKYKPKGIFEKTLRFNLIAFYIFWFVLSFYTHIEINWGMLGLIPLVYLGYKHINLRHRMIKWFYYLFPLSILLAITLRALLVFPEILPVGRLKTEFMGWDNFSETLDRAAGDRPVVMMSRYQAAVKFAFHSESKFVHTIHPRQPSDFLLFGTEEIVRGADVLLASPLPFETADSIVTDRRVWYVKKVDNFQSYKSMKLEVKRSKEGVLLVFNNSNEESLTFVENKEWKTDLYLQTWKGDEKLEFKKLGPAQNYLRKSVLDLEKVEGEELSYQFFIKTGVMEPLPCSRIFE